MQNGSNHYTVKANVSLSSDQMIGEIEAIFQQGLAFHKQNDLTNALLHYQRTLELEPRHAGALHFLGVIALIQKDHAKAISYFDQALAICDSKPVYWNNYGAALKETQRYAEAKTAFEKAISLNSGYADAWSNFSQILLLLNEDEKAIEHAINKALVLVPNHPNALSHLAELRYRQKRYRECAETLEKILPVFPNDVAILCRIAENYARAKWYEKAASHFAKALELNPQHAELRHRYATVFGETGATDEAKRQFRQAAMSSGGKSIWRWKHLWYCPVYFDNTQQIDDYWHKLNADLDEAITEDNVYDWRTLVYDGFAPSFHLPHHDKCCREVKEKFTRLFAKSFSSFQRPELKFPHRKSGKIRVGFLVTPGHEGGFLRYTSGILERLNIERFEPVLIYHRDSVRHFESLSRHSHIHHLAFDGHFERSVQTIRETSCDIIYYWKVGADLWNLFLPMCRLAPIQFTSWGTHGTCGVEHVDYSLSYKLAEIDNAQEHYTEKLFLLDEAPAFQPRMTLPRRLSRKELGLSETDPIYYCPHRLSKYHPDFDAYLKGILEADPQGRILILMGEDTPVAEQFQQRMRRHIGPTLGRRLIFIPRQTPKRYNQLLAAATVLLDSHIYSGGITAYDSLAYGVPCVTKAGPLLVQRYPLSSYAAMAVDNAPIASNREEYVQHAVRLGTDNDYYNQLVNQIYERHELVFERESVVGEFERFFEKIITEY